MNRSNLIVSEPPPTGGQTQAITLDELAQAIYPRWMSLQEATAYCPYGGKKLIQLVKDKTVDGGQQTDKKNAWFIDRLALDAHMKGMLINRDMALADQNFLHFWKVITNNGSHESKAQ